MIFFRVLIAFGFALCASITALAQNGAYNGLSPDLSNVFRVSNAKTFSISPENPTGEKGKGGMAAEGAASRAARDLGRGWKVNPFVVIEPGKTFNLAQIAGSGAIQHIWLTPTGNCPYLFFGCIGTTRASLQWKCRSAIFLPWGGTSTRRSLRFLFV